MSQADSTWADVGRRCTAAEPVRNAPLDASLAARRRRFDGLTSVDIDERGNRLAHGFRAAASIRAAEERIKPLELPCYLVAFVIQQPAISR